MTRTIATVAAAAALALLGSLGVAAPASASPYCGITWGSMIKTRDGYSATTHLTDIRSGRHECFDRLVLDLDDDITGYSITYVPRVVDTWSGQEIPLDGGAALMIVLNNPAFDEDGEETFDPAHPEDVLPLDGYRTFRQVAMAGSFEGETVLGLGVRARLPMRAFLLDGPGDGSRIVVDVAHQW